MTQPSNEKSVERVLAGLDYKLKATKKTMSNKLVKKVVILEKKQNKRELLSLSYYSISIVQHMVMDIVIGKVLFNLSKK
jgi:hypothetical protein